MENELYKTMVNNAKKQIESQDASNPKDDDFSIFVISEVLALLVCKTKEEVIMDILNAEL